MSSKASGLSIRKQTLHRSAYSQSQVDQFLTGQLSESTRRAYEADLRHFFSFLGFEVVDLVELQTISYREVTAFRNQLAQQGYKRTSINRKLSSLKALFKMLVAAGQIEKNPADSTLVRGYKVDENLSGKAIDPHALKNIFNGFIINWLQP